MRRILYIFGIISLLLAGCQGSTPLAVDESNPGQAPTPAAYAASPTAVRTTAATQTPAGMSPVSSSSPGCTVQSPFPTPGPTEQSLFPPPGEKDWLTGPASAQVTLTEYSDFQ